MCEATNIELAQSNPDTIEGLVEAGIPLRTLLAYGLRCLDWLMLQPDDCLRISYADGAGRIVSEKVTRVGLMRRAAEQGWEPWPSDGDDSECICFYGAVVYHDEADGTWWWTSEWDEETGAPLCFSTQKLARLREASTSTARVATGDCR